MRRSVGGLVLRKKADIVRKRFRNLRDRFAKEQRAKKGEMLEGKKGPPVFKKMMFLLDHVRRRGCYDYLYGGEDETSQTASLLRNELETESQAAVDQSQTQEETTPRVEEIQPSAMATQIFIVEDPNFLLYGADTSKARKVFPRFRRIEPKIDEHQNKRLKTSSESEESELKYKPTIVTIGSKEINTVEMENVPVAETEQSPIIPCTKENQNIVVATSHEPSKKRVSKKRTSVVEVNCTQEPVLDPNSEQQIAQDSSKPKSEDRSSIDTENQTTSSQQSCNEAFCVMLKDYLDQVTQPLKLSLLRIKILTILHNELYGKG